MFQYSIIYKGKPMIVFSHLTPVDFMFQHFITEIISVTSTEVIL